MIEHSPAFRHIDPLSVGAQEAVLRAKKFGISHIEARKAYRLFYREGQTDATWLDTDNRTVGARQQEGATTKFTLRLEDKAGVETESVLIPMTRRNGTITHTLCVSSQVGCAMGCRFCETAQMGLVKNLDVADIIAQWHVATHEFKIRPKNIVFMGMGEPTDNLDAVIPAIRILTDHDAAAIGSSNISISTVGNPDGIRRIGKLSAEPGYRRINLAVSLNAPNDEIRRKIMPTAKAWPMADLMDAMQNWPGRPRSAICVEYVLIPGVNDALEHCDEMCEYLKNLRCTLNVIPYNPRRHSPWPAPEETSVAHFIDRAIANGQFTKRRGTKGRTVMAACGQLGNPELRKSRRPTSPPVDVTISPRISKGTHS